jgi:hypothetical protein
MDQNLWERGGMKMDRGKILVCLLILGLFALNGYLTPLGAAEGDNAALIKVLQDKKVLSEQEAEQLLKEVEKSSRATAEKGSTKAPSGGEIQLPTALKGFRFSTTIFSEWNNLKPDDTASKNQFTLNRAYLTLLKDVNPWLGVNLTADITSAPQRDTSTGSVSSSSQGWELRMKYAYVNLNLLGTNTLLGLVPTPSDAYDSAIWPYRVQGKHLLDDLSIQASADYGLVNIGTFGGYMDDEYLQYASKQFAGRWGGWMVGLFNGSGYTTSEANNNKVVSGLVYVRPLPDVPILKGLQLAYTGTYGKSNSTFATGPTTDYPDWQVNITQASLQHKWFKVMGQYFWGKATATSAEENKRDAWLVDAFVRIPNLEKARVFGKWYTHDPDTNTANNSYDTKIVGVSYDVSKEFMPFIAWEHRNYDTQTASLKNYDKYQIGFQLKF